MVAVQGHWLSSVGARCSDGCAVFAVWCVHTACIVCLPEHACRVLCMPVQVGKEGVITVQDGKTLENELEVCARCAVLCCALLCCAVLCCAVNMLCCNPAGS